jgi:type IV pilus assembly protein PilP
MRKITFLAFSIFICFFSTEFLVFAAEMKNALPPPHVPSMMPVALQTQVAGKQPAESTYNYNPLGKPDPFRPFVEAEIAVKKKEAKTGLTSIFPLQRDDVEKFKVVGIAGDQSRRVAVVEDITKKYYPLFIGTHIGLSNGKVKDILPDRVIVEEYVGKKAKRIILKLHKNQNEVKP